jgi:hypothetical protein
MDLRYLIIGGTVLCIGGSAGHALAQTDAVDDEAHSITLVGCVMRESDFREMYGPGQSGPRGPGIGLRNEYMLVDAHAVTPSGSNPGVVETTGTCPPAPGGFPTAYELTGPREKEVAPFLGHRIELTGMQKRAKTRPVGTSGLREPTGGFDPLGHELHLFEVEVASFHDAPSAPAAAAAAVAPAPAPEPVAPAEPVAAAPPAPAPEAEVAAAAPAPAPPEPPAPAPAEAPVAAAPPPPPAPEPAPAPQVSTAQQAPAEPPRQVAQAPLPKTASPLPLVGLIGLLSLSVAAGMRVLRRRD